MALFVRLLTPHGMEAGSPELIVILRAFFRRDVSFLVVPTSISSLSLWRSLEECFSIGVA